MGNKKESLEQERYRLGSRAGVCSETEVGASAIDGALSSAASPSPALITMVEIQGELVRLLESGLVLVT